jgi:endonuclease/exonuclease/phosphatase family metal-dependent hydrolase
MIHAAVLSSIILGTLTSQAQATPYVAYHKDNVAEERTEVPSKYSVLTLNACMMDGNLPTLYGGMTETAQRIDRLAEFILNENPDIFLGQELMLDSGQQLYDRLKSNYNHIWVGIGKIPGKEQSGLFIATKNLPVTEPQFIPFPDDIQVDKKYFPNQTRFIERGFVCLNFGDFWIVNTHLEAGGEKYQGPSHRANQLACITAYMDRVAEGKPYILAGDLNIMRTGKVDDEYTHSIIPEQYYDFRTVHYPSVDKTTYTCTNYFTELANNRPIPPEEELNEIDDYFLIRRPFESRFLNLQIELIDTYDITKPRESAITDHKAYKATFQMAP